jgi:hypothetical protein
MAPICSTISGLCYADDQIVGFPHRSDAERFLNDLSERLAAFALSLHLERPASLSSADMLPSGVRLSQQYHPMIGGGHTKGLPAVGVLAGS